MNYEQKYNKLVNAVKILKETNPSDEGIQNWVNENVPELEESEDEIPQKLHNLLCAEVTYEQFEKHNLTVDSALDWLEKQGESKNIDSDDLETLEIWEDAIKENKEKWQLSDWFVEATSLLIKKVKRIDNNENINIKGSKVMLNACINALRAVGHSHLSDWLEKQGGQKAINDTDEDIVEAVKDTSILDMVEPKFHVGDWIVTDKNHIWLIDEDCSTTGYSYRLISQNGKVEVGDYNIVDEHARLWTIQDAKDGDVLYLQHDGKEHIIIYKGVIKERFRTFISAYCAYNSIVDAFCFADVSRYADIAYGGIMPATKEQRDLLFSKMKEAGYEWDDEKKEPKLLITNGGDFESENCEQNPAWSEEDDRTLDYLLAVLEDGIPTDSGKMGKIVDWLRTLKQRYIWKPSEEQIKAIRLARSFVTDDFGDNPTLSEILIELEKQLNKLK